MFRLPDVSRSFLLLLFPAQWLTTIGEPPASCAGASSSCAPAATTSASSLIVGAGPRGQAFAAQLEDHRELGLQVRGFVDDEHVRPAARLEAPRAAREHRDLPPRRRRRRGRDLPAVQPRWTRSTRSRTSARRSARSSGCRSTCSIARSRPAGSRTSTARPSTRSSAGRTGSLALVVKRAFDVVVAGAGAGRAVAAARSAIALVDPTPRRLAGAVSPGAGRPPRPAVRGPQVPDDGARRRGAATTSSSATRRSAARPSR